MSVTINIPQFLQPDTGDVRAAKVEGDTVGECLNDLVRQFPRLKPLLFNSKNRKLHRYLDVFVNKKSSHPLGLDKPVASGDELYIFNIIVGG